MTATITIFPCAEAERRHSYGQKFDRPATVIILPVVRIERHPDEPPRGPGRQSRRRILEKVRELQEELMREPRS